MEVKFNANELSPAAVQSSIGNIQKTEDYLAEIRKKAEDMPLDRNQTKHEYDINDAVMDLEAIKRFFYMLAGIEYVPKNEFGYEKKDEIWA